MEIQKVPANLLDDRSSLALPSQSEGRHRRSATIACPNQSRTRQVRPTLYNTPLELGTPVCRGSISQAIRIALAVALKIASAMWWVLRP
jgi:hypothetical protein